MTTDAPELPPAFNGMLVPPDIAPIGAAAEGVAAGRLSAGDVLWSARDDRASAAFVLEPDVPLERAAEMLPVLMVAIGDALGAIGPPNLALTFRWPGTILANGAVAGEVQAFVWPGRAPEEIPDFLVVAFDIALTESADGSEPGHDLGSTYLHVEGCGDLDRTMVIEAVARHFLSWIDGWQQDGFGAAHASWTGRAHDRNADVTVDFSGRQVHGKWLGLDENGGLLVKTANGGQTLALYETIGENEKADA
ncbi:biotin/lipoate--protein ligase family protein [Oricola cellulosilytica]|uniref:biotin--[biotin carboxyl-carrier protein] ligase n=1 Tax=Oricola cellulosilytica TaxID=1429082 RepID=A0A4R0P4X5_9HYPH|nr:biotin/lipoate--protein ligase family protein [Oricola cellulosilytica]TCD11913.1 hypothetical protein E0D97_16410 [Oricola cellulosilytica]